MLIGGEALFQDLLAVGDEQEPRARQLRPQARVVDSRHHRLTCARCRHEEVAVVALLARKLELLEQRLLERPRLDLDRTE